MNRTILIVLVDFLLLSLLAFSTVDINQAMDTGPQRTARETLTTNQPDSGKDLAAVMRIALDDERKNRDLLLGELEKTRQTVGEQQELLSEREKRVQTVQHELQSREQQAAALAKQQAELQQEFASAQTNLQSLGAQLQRSSTESLLSQEKLLAMEAELKKRSEEAAALQRQLADLAKTNQSVLSEKQRLASQLQVAEVEKRHATEQAAKMQQQVQLEREEKAKLAEGVKALASRSGELATEIRENRPLTPNAIFNEFLTNRISARLLASRPGTFGNESSRRRDASTVLASDGTNIVALSHIDETPIILFNPGTDWHRLVGTFARNTTLLPIPSLSFHRRDPRIVWMPISAPEARKLGSKVYRLSSDPYKFEDAVLVGAKEGYYGECRFEIDQTTPEHVRLDRNVLKGLFGKFNPSRGDLVFSKNGELLGIMANNTYCMVIRKLEPAATFEIGKDLRTAKTGDTLARLHTQVLQMPLKLQ